jgi:hypothetical protein
MYMKLSTLSKPLRAIRKPHKGIEHLYSLEITVTYPPRMLPGHEQVGAFVETVFLKLLDTLGHRSCLLRSAPATG